MKSQERRMKILLLLQSRTRNITIDYLAEYFDVSRRTIFRDLRLLQNTEVPLTYEEGIGYGIMKGYNIPPLMFNPREVATVMVGLNFVKSQIDKEMVDDARAVELKIKSVVPVEIKQLMDVLSEKVILDPYTRSIAVSKSSGNWYTLANAVAQHKTVTFTYENKERILKPLIVVYYSDHWNVIGYSGKDDAVRSFRLEKIVDLEIPLGPAISLKKTYTNDELIYRNDSVGTQIKLHLAAEKWNEFRKSCPAIILSHNTIDNRIEVAMEFDNLDYLNEWLLRFGTAIEITYPEDLKDKRNRLLEKMRA